MWDDLVRGAIGAVVLVDTRRLSDSFAPVDFFEDRGLPFILGLNCFDGALLHPVSDVRAAMGIGPDVPVVPCDARNRESVKQTLITLVEHAMRNCAIRPRMAQSDPAEPRHTPAYGEKAVAPAWHNS